MLSTYPRIGMDCRFAATKSGIGRYTRELVAALLKRNDPWHYVLFVRDAKHHGLGELPSGNNWQLAVGSWQHYSLKEQLCFPSLIRKTDIDLLHVPHFNAPLHRPIPFIATIHDLILHRFPNEASLPKRIAYRFLMRNTVRKAARLIAVSRATADELASTYGEGIRNRTSVIHEGMSKEFQRVSEDAQQRVRKKYNLPDHFLLYVGAAKEHKNVQTLIEACPADQMLVLVTGGKEASCLKIRGNVRVLSHVPDEDLSSLYSAASCLVSPSLAEGFNFPVLEALACGCPVIATKRGSTPEITEKFAMLVEPTPEGLQAALEHLPQRPSKEAIAHAHSFSWERAAEETANVYASVLS